MNLTTYEINSVTILLFLPGQTHSVDKVAQVGQELIVVSGNEFGPQEGRVAVLRSLGEEIIPPNLRGLSCLSCIVAKHTNIPTLAELCIFVVQILSARDGMKHGPGFFGTEQRSWK